MRRGVYGITFFILVFLSGCTLGDPDYYQTLFFHGESDNWSVGLNYVEYSESDRRPPDTLTFTYKGENKNDIKQLRYEIEKTDIKVDKEVSDGKVSDEVAGLEPLFDGMVDDGLFEEDILVKVSWDSQEEVIALQYKDFEQEDARTFGEKLLGIFDIFK